MGARLWRAGLPAGIVSPTFDAAIRSQSAAVFTANGNRLEGARRRRIVDATRPPAPYGAVVPQRARKGVSAVHGLEAAVRRIVRPAAYNGTVGIKPTLGLVSRYGVMPVSWSLDTMGWFTRTVEDAAIVLGVLAQHDPNDDISLTTLPTDYTAALNSVTRPKIGFMRQYFVEDATPEVQDHVDHIVAKLIEAGAAVEEVRIPIDMHAGREAHGYVQNAEAADAHETDFAAHADEYMPTTRGVIENGMAIPVTKYIQAQALRRDLRRELLNAGRPYDAILTPSTIAPAPDTSTTGNPACQWAWTTVGFPSISIPSGLSEDGLPLGIQLASAPIEEATLLSVAHWCEQVLDVHLTRPCEGHSTTQ